MKIEIMTGLLAMGLMVGCATHERDDMARNDGALMEESAGAETPSVGTKFSELPAAVQKAVRAHSPNAEIDDIDKETRSGRVVYEIQFAEPGKNPKLHVAEDGSIVSGE